MSAFNIHIKEIAYGNCDLDMSINDKIISCMPSYMGPNPLNTLIEACLSLLINIDDDGEEMGIENTFRFGWSFEPGQINFDLLLDNEGFLHVDMIEYKDEFDNPKTKMNEWHEMIPFSDFKNAVISEAFRVLKQYGLYGYRCSWSDRAEFPLSALLRIAGKTKVIVKNDSYISDFAEENNSLNEILKMLE